jgi:hypothetical protein
VAILVLVEIVVAETVTTLTIADSLAAETVIATEIETEIVDVNLVLDSITRNSSLRLVAMQRPFETSWRRKLRSMAWLLWLPFMIWLTVLRLILRIAMAGLIFVMLILSVPAMVILLDCLVLSLLTK